MQRKTGSAQSGAMQGSRKAQYESNPKPIPNPNLNPIPILIPKPPNPLAGYIEPKVNPISNCKS